MCSVFALNENDDNGEKIGTAFVLTSVYPWWVEIVRCVRVCRGAGNGGHEEKTEPSIPKIAHTIYWKPFCVQHFDSWRWIWLIFPSLAQINLYQYWLQIYAYIGAPMIDILFNKMMEYTQPTLSWFYMKYHKFIFFFARNLFSLSVAGHTLSQYIRVFRIKWKERKKQQHAVYVSDMCV